MRRVPLHAMAHARSGDKGDGTNVGIIAYDDRSYEILRDRLTPERVKAHFKGMVSGDVERFELPNLRALNFILHRSLGGSGSASLKNDAQGKTHGMAMLRMMIDVPDDYLVPEIGDRGPLPPDGELREEAGPLS